jgi:hypothetical protein
VLRKWAQIDVGLHGATSRQWCSVVETVVASEAILALGQFRFDDEELAQVRTEISVRKPVTATSGRGLVPGHHAR